MIVRFDKKLIKTILLLCLVVLSFIGCYFLLSWLDRDSGKVDLAGWELESTGRPEKNLTTLLLLGVDKTGKMEAQKSNINDEQVDFLTLVLLDEDTDSYNILQLNRDTMTPVDVLGVGGVKIEQKTMQLALSHTYGDAMEESCENSVRAVERLLDVEIDHYLAINMTGMTKLVDAIGGVTVTIMEDFSNLDPTLIQGETMLLNGTQCMTYVRGRQGVGDQSNLNRINRQKQFMEELLPTMKDSGDLAIDAIAEIADYMLTDLSGNRLERLLSRITESTFQEIYTTEGEAIVGDRFMEFYPDKEALVALVDKLFYLETEA